MQTEIAKVATACRLPGFRYVVFVPPVFPEAPAADAPEAPVEPELPIVLAEARAPAAAPAAPPEALPSLAADVPARPAVATEPPAQPRLPVPPRILSEVFPTEEAAVPSIRSSAPIWPARPRPRAASAGFAARPPDPALPPRPVREAGRYPLLDEVAGSLHDQDAAASGERRRSASALLAALRRRTPH